MLLYANAWAYNAFKDQTNFIAYSLWVPTLGLASNDCDW